MFLELLLQADKFLMLMNDLWVRGLLHDGDYEMNERKRSDFELEIKRMLNTVNVTVLRQQRAILNRLRNQNGEAPTKGNASGSKAAAAPSSSKPTAADTPSQDKKPAAKPKRVPKSQADQKPEAAANEKAEQAVVA
jgi:hypothetical protein